MHLPTLPPRAITTEPPLWLTLARLRAFPDALSNLSGPSGHGRMSNAEHANWLERTFDEMRRYKAGEHVERLCPPDCGHIVQTVVETKATTTPTDGDSGSMVALMRREGLRLRNAETNAIHAASLRKACGVTDSRTKAQYNEAIKSLGWRKERFTVYVDGEYPPKDHDVNDCETDTDNVVEFTQGGRR